MGVMGHKKTVTFLFGIASGFFVVMVCCALALPSAIEPAKVIGPELHAATPQLMPTAWQVSPKPLRTGPYIYTFILITNILWCTETVPTIRTTSYIVI